ncbi:MAG TPA: hypothetical protein DE015_09150 [Oceanospirillales bacterium]|nr:hypothetical protein [Oceanospirillales bacterium]
MSRYLIYEQNDIVEIYESIVFSYRNPNFNGDSFWGGMLIYLYACDKLKVDVRLSERIIENLHTQFDDTFNTFDTESGNSIPCLRLILDKAKPL